MIICLRGGLGNQMWQFACCLRLRSMGKKAIIDDFEVRQNALHRAELFRCFNIKGEEIPILIHFYWRIHIALWVRIRRLFFGERREIPGYYIESLGSGCEIEKLFDSRKKYAFGYWQGYKYIQAIERTIRKMFCFPHLDSKNQKYSERMKDVISVSVHIRGRDYLDETNSPIYGGICDQSYYSRAISYIIGKMDGNKLRFFIFSDDLDYVKNMNCFIGEDVVFVTGNEGADAYRDMQLMSMCTHNIIANSSFSFWGAWLNTNPNKTVIAPTRWMNTVEIDDMCPKEWVRL